MCEGISKCAEIVRNLCGGATAHISHSIGVGLPRMCAHKFRAIFAQILNFSHRPGCTGKNVSRVRGEDMILTIGKNIGADRPFERQRPGTSLEHQHEGFLGPGP